MLKKIYNHNRRVLLSKTDIDLKFLSKIFNKTTICIFCNRKMQYKINNHDDYKTVDHIVPLSKGGNNMKKNIQIICFSCNCKKSSKTHTDITKKKMSESAKTRITTEENETKRRISIGKAHSKIVLKCDLEGNILEEYESVTIAAKTINSHVGSIVHAIQGKRVTKHKNYKWKYKQI